MLPLGSAAPRAFTATASSQNSVWVATKIAIVGAIVAGGIVIASLEPLSKFSKREPMLGRAETVLKAQYHAWALLLSGDERDWATWSQRLFRVGFLTLSMIIIAT